MMFNQQRTAIRDDARLMSSARNEWLLRLIDDELGGRETPSRKRQGARRLSDA